jgi:hypothetical protein
MSGTGLAKAAAFVLLHNVFAFFMDVVALARAVIRDVTLALPRFTLDGLDIWSSDLSSYNYSVHKH